MNSWTSVTTVLTSAEGLDVNKNRVWQITGPVVGAAGGYAYYKWIACRGGG